MKKINNKGYMLVEIVLASVIAFGIAYFIINMTIKLKNKNDDMFIESLVVTDKSIISNKLMQYAMDEEETFNCSKLIKEGNAIKYGTNQIDIVNEYATVGDIECNNYAGVVNITIPLEVKQMSDKDFDAVISYKYRIGDMVAPTCNVVKSNTGTTEGVKTTVTCSDNSGSCELDSTGDTGLKESKTYTATDSAGLTGTCTATVNKQVQYRTVSTKAKTCQHIDFGKCGGGCKTYTCCRNAGYGNECSSGPSQIAGYNCYCSVHYSTYTCYGTDGNRCGWDTSYGSWTNTNSCTSSGSTECRTIYN